MILYTNDVPGRQAETKDRMRIMANQNLQNVKSNIQSNFNQIWANPLKLTAQQVFDSWGTDAATILALSQQIVASVIAIDPTYVPPSPATLNPPHSVAVNLDGTVTVT